MKPVLSHPLFNNVDGKDWEWVQVYLFVCLFFNLSIHR